MLTGTFNRAGLTLSLTLILSGGLTGCTVQPVPLSQDDIAARADIDLRRLQQLEAPVTGPISLYEAMSRALAYNLDLSLEDYKSRLVDTELTLSRYDQLPDLVVDYVADGRSNFAGGVSQSLLTGRESLEPSTSSDRYTRRSDLGLSWDILDFGVSYFRARQAADTVLLAREQRRSVVTRILSDVQASYWRAVSYERHRDRLDALMQKVRARLADSRKMEADGVAPPLTTLSYQRDLIRASRDLYQLYQDLSQAKIELAFLMNIPAGTPFQLVHEQPVEPPGQLTGNVDVERLERQALENRSELMELNYQRRMNTTEVKASALALLPGISLDYGRNRNSNSFLFNTNWTDQSARISWNLLDLFRASPVRQRGQVQSDILDAQQLALSAAVLTQLHVGLARFDHATIELELASDLSATQDRILDQVQRAVLAESGTEQALVREEVNALLESVRYDIAYVELRDARSDVYSALGMSPSLEVLDTTDLRSLTRSLEAFFSRMALQEPPGGTP